MGDRVQRPRKHSICEGVVQQIERHCKQLTITKVLHPVTLQCAQVFGIAEVAAQLLEDLPVTPRLGGPDHGVKVPPEIRRHTVVVEEGIVDVEQEDGWGLGQV